MNHFLIKKDKSKNSFLFALQILEYDDFPIPLL